MKSILLPVSFFLCLICTQIAHAEFKIETNTTSLEPNQEIELQTTLSLQNQANKKYYLQAAFKKETTNNYFGLIWNDTNWIAYSSSNFTNSKVIETDEKGNWQGIVKAKIDQNSKQFDGDGNYILQLKRFTPAGSSTFSDNSVNITLINTPILSTPPPNLSTPSPSPTDKPKSQFLVNYSNKKIDSNQTLSANIELTNLIPNAIYFLKAAFFKSGSSNYFGKTKVNNIWVKNNQTFSSQFKITTDSLGNWSGSLEIMPDSDDNGFTNSDNYLIKIGRYSNTGSNLTWSPETSIYINKIATSSPTPPIKTSFPTPTPKNKLTNLEPEFESTESSFTAKIPELTNEFTDIQGIATNTSHLDPPSEVLVKNQKIKYNFWLIIPGLIFFIIGASILVYLLKKR